MAAASLPSSSPPPQSHPSISASLSESFTTLPTALVLSQAQVDATSENRTLNVDDEMPQIADHFAVLDNPEYIEKYMKFEADSSIDCKVFLKEEILRRQHF